MGEGRLGLEFLLLIVGVTLLVGGAEALVRGGSGLARDLGVSPLVVGLTVVAFGTSAPELAVNVDASLRGQGGLSFGNIIGSNIANIGLVIGCFALLRPIPVEGTIIRREMPMMIAATLLVTVMGLGWFGNGSRSLDKTDGVILLIFFAVFLYYTVADVFRQRATDPFVVQTGMATPGRFWGSLPLNVGLTLGGLLALVGGAELTVRAAVELAAAFGVPQVVIGLSLVALGTSLPELVTGVVAALRSQSDLAVGNIVGSNIFNLLFVAGVSASISPIPVPRGGGYDLAVLCLLSFLMLFICLTHRQQIIRREAVLLLVIYFLYIGSRILI
jgi:cation:H+ antiporter